MDWEVQLIFVYLTVCDFFSQETAKAKLRKSPNVYIFGIISGYRTIKHMHQFAYVHLKQWFPYLPKYKAFNHRLNFIKYAFVEFSDEFIHTFRTKTDHPFLQNSKTVKSLLIKHMLMANLKTIWQQKTFNCVHQLN